MAITKIPQQISLDEVGFNDVAHIFRLYGHNLHPTVEQKCSASLSIGLFQVIFGLVVATCGFLIAAYGFVEALAIMDVIETIVVAEVKRRTFDFFCMAISGAILQMSWYVQHLFFCLSFKKTKSRLQHMAKTIDKLLKDNKNRKVFIRKNRIAGSMLKLSLFVTTACMAGIIFVSMESGMTMLDGMPDKLPQKQSLKIRFRVTELVYAFWMFTTFSFCIFYNLLLLFLCHSVSTLMDYAVPSSTEPREPSCQTAADLGRHQKSHRAVSKLVNDVNDMFSQFLLGTMMIELVLIVVYTRAISSISWESDFATSITLSAIQLTLFILKNLACSSLNSKISERLTPGQRPNVMGQLQHCDDEHVKYILYLKKFAANPIQMTYGGLFSVDKNFILSIAGTILSYALFLRQFE